MFSALTFPEYLYTLGSQQGVGVVGSFAPGTADWLAIANQKVVTLRTDVVAAVTDEVGRRIIVIRHRDGTVTIIQKNGVLTSFPTGNSRDSEEDADKYLNFNAAGAGVTSVFEIMNATREQQAATAR